MVAATEFAFGGALPPSAAGALEVVRTLTDAGHEALLAGGCVRDLLLGRTPQDYDVATSAPPERVCALFHATRRVGVQFGVVLVKRRRRWIEVATFRSDGPYLDGRRPSSVTLTDAGHDALRRDFTVNGMFLDPQTMRVIDYVGGRADLEARVLRAIGDPAARFAEDYLRLLRTVRFAARLDFPIEAATLAAVRTYADRLAHVAPERVREELERMLAHPARRRAWVLLQECGLLPYLWPGADWSSAAIATVETQLGRLPPAAEFELALAVVLCDRDAGEIERIARALTLSNEQHEITAWLVAHRGDLDDPARPTLAELKRLMAHPAFDALYVWTLARMEEGPDAPERRAQLAGRLDAIGPETIQPPPLVRGDDLLARQVQPGPIYAELLHTLYTRQLDEELTSREQALAVLDQLLAARGVKPE